MSDEEYWHEYFYVLLPDGDTKKMQENDGELVRTIAGLADIALEEQRKRFPKAQSANGAEGVKQKG
jgi:hypothetical protein